jgi:hypothetical protein
MPLTAPRRLAQLPPKTTPSRLNGRRLRSPTRLPSLSGGLDPAPLGGPLNRLWHWLLGSR